MRNKVVTLFLIITVIIVLNLIMPEIVKAASFYDEDITWQWSGLQEGDANSMAYGVCIPSTADELEKLPAIVWLHGSGSVNLSGNGLPQAVLNWEGECLERGLELKGFSAYVMCPYMQDTNGYWSDSNNVSKLKGALDKFISQYNVDTENIVLMGNSRGGTGAMHIGNYLSSYFSKCVVCSGYSTDVYPTIPTICFTGTSDDPACISAANTYASVLGDANVFWPGTSHGSVPHSAIFKDNGEFPRNSELRGNGGSDLIEWMFGNYDVDEESDEDNKLVKPIAQLLCFIPDAVLETFQKVFVTSDEFCNDRGNVDVFSIKYSPAIIFSGEVPAFDIDFITYEESEDENTEKESTAKVLQGTIANFYNALRKIALVGLLSVLLYMGIRIVLGSTSAKDKAKYKAMLKDWLIALCILFTLHYIMSIVVTIVENITAILKVSTITSNGEDVMMTTIRNNIANGKNWSEVIVEVVLYFVLAIYTIIFTIQYLRRTIYLAFLTVIAPLITLTYPLDKIKDSKSQAFDMWFKDYIFFTLLQIVHLLIYYILVGSAIDLADQGNWVFAIVAIGCMIPAEKLIKKMFGFEKSKSLGALAAGASGALIMNAMNKLSRKRRNKEKWGFK